jgi:uncharacterized protein (TIGR02270 family)
MIPAVVSEHGEEAGSLHERRCALLKGPHARLHDLLRLDERIAAHLDGLALAGEEAQQICEAMLDSPSPGSIFAFAAHALARGRGQQVERALRGATERADLRDALIAAFGWSNPDDLRGLVALLLRGEMGVRRLIGVAACSLHRVDPGVVMRLNDEDPVVRARVLRTIGEIGRREMISTCARAMRDEDPLCRFWAAWSAVLLGDREDALSVLSELLCGGFQEQRALQLALQTAAVDRGHALLQLQASEPTNVRLLIKGAGYVGDPRYIPWLIGQTADDKLARLAGESFSTMTGLDLWQPPFFRPRPDGFESGPTDNPEDQDVEMDEDDGLPWPDQAQIQAWWNQKGARFTTGVRHFVGAPPSHAHCVEVLRNGSQRQRIGAAYHLCLLSPGTPLFEWRAPAWRQQRELAQLT